jgi:NADPH:quinone reductase-like Zn-dependent oxidoreductase
VLAEMACWFVYATSVNPAEWTAWCATIALPAFGLFKPRTKTLGVDFAGTVEAVGKRHAVSNRRRCFRWPRWSVR